MINNKFNKNNPAFLIAALIMCVFTALFIVSASALTDTTRPTILSVSPVNNQMSIATDNVITVKFSELMNPSTINANTFVVFQRTTPAIGSSSSAYRSIQLDGKVTYSGLVATFTPTKDQQNPMQPSQEYGNVFTTTITAGAKDLAGNSLSQNYMWSFTTGENVFNTGATTSQLSQNHAATSGSVATTSSTQSPITIIPVTSRTVGSKIAAASQSPLFWFIGGLLLVLIIGLIIALSMRPTRQKNVVDSSASPSKPSHLSPFGDVHPVMDLEGIGLKYNEELQAVGIKNTQQLWEGNAAKIAHQTGAPLSSVKSWQNMAELASVKDIGPQYAELLERSGIHNINQLQNSNSNKLLKQVREKQNSLKLNIQGNIPGHALVENWINQARDHKFSKSEGQIA